MFFSLFIKVFLWSILVLLICRLFAGWLLDKESRPFSLFLKSLIGEKERKVFQKELEEKLEKEKPEQKKKTDWFPSFKEK